MHPQLLALSAWLPATHILAKKGAAGGGAGGAVELWSYPTGSRAWLNNLQQVLFTHLPAQLDSRHERRQLQPSLGS